MENSPAGTAGQIRSLGEQLVILDIDLASLLEVSPEQLNALVRKRWPEIAREFAFPVSHEQVRDLLSDADDARFREGQESRLAYTEHGVIVVCAIFDDPRTIQLLINLVRAFVARRESLESSRRARPKPELH